MAYEYDQLGNVIGQYESEEERRRREALEQPVKQTTVFNPDGSQEMTIKGTPEALSAANPYTPTVTGPVAPDQTYGRMLQVESGNRDYDRQGRPVTSPAGAMFASQVMPATARQPGYGIRPAAAQTPEEYNRVGQEYFQAMRRQFPGNEAAAIAAYNAGPGRVQQNIRANQGQMNVAQLPRETQGYLQKVGNMVGNMIPSAQASTLPPQQAASPQPQPASTFQGQTNEFGGMEEPTARSQYSLGTGVSGQGLQAPQPAQPVVDTKIFDFYQRNQDNPQALITMGFSDAPGIPDFLKDRMKNRAAEMIQQQREEAAAQKQIPNMTESEIARALRERTTGGSYVKAALFGLLGMEQSAQAEAAKLGVGKETLTSINGQPALVKMAANGTPIEGFNAATGKKLSAEELVIAAQGGGALGKGTSLSADVYVDPTTGNRYRSGYDGSGRAAMVDIQGGAAYRGDPRNLKLQSIDTAQARADIGLITDLKKKHGNNVLDAEKDYVALNGPFKSAADRAQFRQAYGFDIAQPAGGAPAAAPAPGQTPAPTALPGQTPAGNVVPTPVPTGPAAAPSNINVPLAEQQQTLEAQKEIKKKQAANSYQARQIAPFVAQIKELIPKTTSSGVGTAVDAAGRLIGVSNEGADAIAAMAPLADKILKTVERFEGPQSDLDVQSYKDASGKLSDPSVPVRQKQAAFATIIEILKRNAPEINWNEALMTKEDKAAVKWADAHPNDPRAKEIKKRFDK